MLSNTSRCLVTETQAAAFLGLRPATLRRWRWDGSGPPFHRIGKRNVRYDPADLAAFVEAGRRASTSDTGPGAR